MIISNSQQGIGVVEDLNTRLEETRQLIREREHVLAMKKEAQQSLTQSLARQKQLRKQLDEEQKDVDRLQGLTLTNLFATVCSTKNERLQKEQEELLEAVLKHDEAEAAVQTGQQEVDRLIGLLEKSADAEQRYENLLETKALAIEQSDRPDAARLFELTDQLANFKADERELNEAINAGESARLALGHVESALNSAANWGTFDMLGGGALVTMAKHSKMDEARSAAHRAQGSLRRFQEELHDAGERLSVAIRIDSFSTFADYFFDGLIADWMVQSKINRARSACQSAKSQVNTAVSSCRFRLAQVSKERVTTESERRVFLEKG